MRYIDTGSRDPAHALGTWLQAILQPGVEEIRCQSGFFSADALGLLLPMLTRSREGGKLARFVIGSNDGGTSRADVNRLCVALSLPRPGADLVVVRFGGGAYFHPKTFHFRRLDGSQCAYVGSANLSTSGLTSLHVEAGVTLDTREGDAEQVLESIARSIDAWCAPGRAGAYHVGQAADLDRLVEAGILAARRLPPTRGEGGEGGTTRGGHARLFPLITLPKVDLATLDPGEEAMGAIGPPPVGPPSRRSVHREGFPTYIWIDPDAVGPTSGYDALSGEQLPEAAVGLVIRLTNDDARVFVGRGGTSNFTVPVRTATALRFGVSGGRRNRVRADYRLRMRYLAEAGTVLGIPDASTNVMLYGYGPGEKGHRNLRMLIPADVRSLAERIEALQLPLPTPGEPALLEWPGTDAPEFRISYLQRGSTLFDAAEEMLRQAAELGQRVGRTSACWLPEGVSPPWT